MSKSALFAGLGQGLMALGQNVGEAYRMKAIEELRQENLQQNWAREDKMRAEDRAFQKDIQKENREYQETVRAEDRSDRVMLNNQRYTQTKALADLERDRKDSEKVAKKVFEQDDKGNNFQVSYDKSGKEISRIQYDPSQDNDTPQATLKEAESYFKQAEALMELDPEGNKERIEKLFMDGRAILRRNGQSIDPELLSVFKQFMNGTNEKPAEPSNTKPTLRDPMSSVGGSKPAANGLMTPNYLDINQQELGSYLKG